ncbi:MAG TPA: DUF6340 family protein [Fluviicola sp.]|nr:DUF6340 family protein [Fluviicola sp.]
MKLLLTTAPFVFLLILASCSGIRGMNVEVMRAAEITVDPEIKNIAIVNRSIPTSKPTLESTLTIEKPAQDKELSEECLRGMLETLNTSARFKTTRVEGTMNAPDERSIAFGAPLAWAVVDSICAANSVEALIVLEYFDTDFSVLNPGATAAAAVGSVLNGGNGQVEARGTATAHAGYRIYYPKTKSIIYEDRFDYEKIWRQQSTNPVDAVAKLIKKNDALIEVSYETGSEFSMNIVPLYYWEYRDMYKGKKGAMERGERQALSRDWEGAIKTWTEVYESSTKSKVRAKAAFNTALGYEVQGDLAKAKEWVQKAYIEDGKDVALRYSDILEERIREQAALKVQTGE